MRVQEKDNGRKCRADVSMWEPVSTDRGRVVLLWESGGGMPKPLGYVNTHTFTHTSDKIPLRLHFCLAVTMTEAACISAPYQSVEPPETRMCTGGDMPTCRGDNRKGK